MVKLPAAADDAPIVVPSTAPPFISTDAKVDKPVTPNVPATVVLPVEDATVNLFVLTSKLPSTPTAPLALIAAAVVVPVTPKVPPTVVLPDIDAPDPTVILLSNTAELVTSNVPGISTLFVHSTSDPLDAVCKTCLAEPSANLLTAICAEALISASTIVPSKILALVTDQVSISSANINCSWRSCAANNNCSKLLFKSAALTELPAANTALGSSSPDVLPTAVSL